MIEDNDFDMFDKINPGGYTIDSMTQNRIKRPNSHMLRGVKVMDNYWNKKNKNNNLLCEIYI